MTLNSDYEFIDFPVIVNTLTSFKRMAIGNLVNQSVYVSV